MKDALKRLLIRNAPLPDGGDDARIDWLSAAIVVLFCLAMLSVPWESLLGGRFVDRSVYLNTFGDFHSRVVPAFADSVIGFIVNEVLWDMSVRWCTAVLHVRAETVFVGISFLCLFVFSKYLTSRHGLVSLIFLINPLVIDFAFAQLRMALAVSLLMLAMFRRKQKLFWVPLTGIACCIHTASFLVIFIFFTVKLLISRLTAWKLGRFYYWLGLIGIGFAIALVLGPFRVDILSAVGDRRVKYENYSQGIKYASFWMLLLLVGGTQGRKYFQNEGNAVATAFLSLFTFAMIFDVYNGRFLSAAYPLIISALLALGSTEKLIILPLYLVYAGAQWYYWLGSGMIQ